MINKLRVDQIFVRDTQDHIDYVFTSLNDFHNWVNGRYGNDIKGYNLVEKIKFLESCDLNIFIRPDWEKPFEN
jgi:hypothetical protein